jgi:beta-phosphoglucomutase
MDAVVFDFDGVIVDSEPVHWAGFARVLRAHGIELSWDGYRERYLGYDDRDCFLAVGRDHGLAFAHVQLAAMTAAKTEVVREVLASSVQALPGAVELIASLHAAGVPLAICSGALRPEIEIAAGRVGVLDRFRTVVAAEDVPRGKPDPSGYTLALQRLCDAAGRPLVACRSVAIEDSPAGIAAASDAGLRVLGVATSYGAAALVRADTIVGSLTEVTPARLAALADGRSSKKLH